MAFKRLYWLCNVIPRAKYGSFKSMQGPFRDRYALAVKQTRHTDRQTDRWTNRQTDRETDRQADRQTGRQTQAGRTARYRQASKHV